MIDQQRQLTDDDWRALGHAEPPLFDAPALEWQGIRTAHAALNAVRSGELSQLCAPAWADTRQALDAFLWPTSDTHCFSVEPHGWAELREPQITKGLAHFLSAGGHRVRTRRILALLHAVRPANAPALDIACDDVINARAVAEGYCGNGRRIDVIAWVQLNDGRRIGTVIEAKVGHCVTQGQLSSYEAAAAKPPYSLDTQSTRFVIVAPSLTHATAKQLRRYPEWKFIAWRVLLTRLGAALGSSDCDHDDFARFRRTIWSCAA